MGILDFEQPAEKVAQYVLTFTGEDPLQSTSVHFCPVNGS